MKRFNKFLALFLVVVMTVGMLPAGVSAAEANSKVIFEEGFENYSTLEFTNSMSIPVDKVYLEQYYTGNYPNGEGIWEIVNDANTGSKSVKLKAYEHSYTRPLPAWVGSEYAIGALALRVNTDKFEPGATYKVSAMFKADKAGSNAYFHVYGDTSIVAETRIAEVGTDWIQQGIEFVVPEGVAASSILFRVGSRTYTAADAYLMIDDICIEKIKDAPDPNVMLDESFESWTDIVSPHNVWYANGNTSVTVSSDKAHDGTKSIKFSPPDQTQQHRAKLNYVVPDAVIDKMEDGAEYTFTAYYYSDGAKYNGNYEFKNKASGYPNGDVALTDGEWVKAELTFTLNKSELPSGKLVIVMGMGWHSKENSVGDLYIDSVSLVKKYDYNTMLEDLAAEDSVALAGNVEATGNDLVLKSGKTLDLAGYTLTVDSLSALKGANIVDTVGGGKLIVDKEDLLLQKTNSYLPVKVDGGYTFVSIKTQHEQLDDGVENTLKYKSKPSFGSSYLADGAADNGLSIILRLTWTNASNGTTTTMDVPCSEEIIKQVYAADSDNAFILTVKGVDNVENLKVATVVCSDTGVAVVGEALAYTAG